MSLSLTEAAEIGRRLSQVTPTTLDRERVARLEDDLRTLKNQADRIERLLVVLGVNPSTVAHLRGNDDACTLDGLMDWVAYRMGLTKTMLMSPSRQCQIAWARQLAMWLAVRHLKLSTETVGRAFHRDHGTVIYARRKVDREIALSSMRGSEAKEIEGEWLIVMKAKGKQSAKRVRTQPQSSACAGADEEHHSASATRISAMCAIGSMSGHPNGDDGTSSARLRKSG